MSEVVDEDVNVLFIEDDPAVARCTAQVGAGTCYRVTVAKSGEEASTRKNQVPDIVFLDIRLPKMDGFRRPREPPFRRVTKNIPSSIPLTTARKNSSTVAEARRASIT